MVKLTGVGFRDQRRSSREFVAEEMTLRFGSGDYAKASVTLTTPRRRSKPRLLGGTVFRDGKPRILSIKGIKVDAEFTPSMIYVTNEDKPGFIGRFASPGRGGRQYRDVRYRTG